MMVRGEVGCVACRDGEHAEGCALLVQGCATSAQREGGTAECTLLRQGMSSDA